MRALSVAPDFGLSNVAVREHTEPAPAADQVLVRVLAASLNYRDLMVLRGEYNPRFQLPLILGSDAVGEVVALGERASEHGVGLGQRVCPLFAQGWLDGPPRRDTVRAALGGPLPGVFADYVVARADSVVPVPEYLTDAEAATLPCAALTAWSALQTLSNLGPSQTLLTLGTGGVSLFAAQIARLVGARVIATTRDPRKAHRLSELGAAAVLDSSVSGWGEAARQFSGGEGVDHVIEVGGHSTLAESLRAVRPGGTISLIGVLGGSGNEQPPPNLLPAVMRNVRLQGVFVGHARSFRALLKAFEAGRVRPVIDSVHPLANAPLAFERLSSAEHVGKVCLSLA